MLNMNGFNSYHFTTNSCTISVAKGKSVVCSLTHGAAFFFIIHKRLLLSRNTWPRFKLYNTNWIYKWTHHFCCKMCEQDSCDNFARKKTFSTLISRSFSCGIIIWHITAWDFLFILYLSEICYFSTRELTTTRCLLFFEMMTPARKSTP